MPAKKNADAAEPLGNNLVISDPLDHDGDGEKGGSLPGEDSTVAKGAKKKKGGSAFSAFPKTWIVLEESADIPPTGLPIGHNGNPFIIKPGEPVEVYDFLLEILDHAVQSGPVVHPQTGQVIGYRDRQRFPYRRIAAPEAVE